MKMRCYCYRNGGVECPVCIKRKGDPKPVTEHKVREAIDKRVEDYGGITRAVAWIGRRSAPDVLVLAPCGTSLAHRLNKWDEGATVWVEAKKPKTPSATAAQNREHARMREAGCKVIVIFSIAALDEWLPPIDLKRRRSPALTTPGGPGWFA